MPETAQAIRPSFAERVLERHGGSWQIRKLEKLDKLKKCVEISREIGNEKAHQACLSMLEHEMDNNRHWAGEPRFISNGKDGKEIRFYPQKMPAYALAKALHFVGRMDREFLYEHCLISQFSYHINDVFNRMFMTESKPSKKQRQIQKHEHEKRVRAFKDILAANLGPVLRRIFNIERKGGYAFISRANPSAEAFEPRRMTKEEKDANNAIFRHLFQEEISFMANSEAFENACSDYMLIQDVLAEPRRFKEIEALCSWCLWDFARNKNVKGMPFEEQYQEGRLVIWEAAKKYRARGLARFRTMAKKALNNRFVDLLRFSLADIRKMNRKMEYIGLPVGPHEHGLAGALERISYGAWVSSQNGHFQSPPDAEGDDPYLSQHLAELIQSSPYRPGEMVAFFGNEDGSPKEITEAYPWDSPHNSDERVQLLNMNTINYDFYGPRRLLYRYLRMGGNPKAAARHLLKQSMNTCYSGLSKLTIEQFNFTEQEVDEIREPKKVGNLNDDLPF
jgi:hypothetical protein